MEALLRFFISCLLAFVIGTLLRKFIKKFSTKKHISNLLSSIIAVIVGYLPLSLLVIIQLTSYGYLSGGLAILFVFCFCELMTAINAIAKKIVIIFSVVVVLLLGFFYPKPSSYSTPGLDYLVVTQCSCFGLGTVEVELPLFSNVRKRCVGIPYSCTSTTKDLMRPPSGGPTP